MRPLLQPANNGAGANRLNRALLLGYGLGSAIIGKGKTTRRSFPFRSSKPVLKKGHTELAWEK
ncbi:MAG: hypothetical protein WCW68_13025 [Methanothrix sp.]